MKRQMKATWDWHRHKISVVLGKWALILPMYWDAARHIGMTWAWEQHRHRMIGKFGGAKRRQRGSRGLSYILKEDGFLFADKLLTKISQQTKNRSPLGGPKRKCHKKQLFLEMSHRVTWPKKRTISLPSNNNNNLPLSSWGGFAAFSAVGPL